MTSIYSISHKTLGICYVGQSKDPQKRFEEHLNSSRRQSTIFARVLRRSPRENWYMTVLEIVEDSEAGEREEYWIQKCDALFNVRATPKHSTFITATLTNSLITQILKYTNATYMSRGKLLSKLIDQAESGSLVVDKKRTTRSTHFKKKNITISISKEHIKRLNKLCVGADSRSQYVELLYEAHLVSQNFYQPIIKIRQFKSERN